MTSTEEEPKPQDPRTQWTMIGNVLRNLIRSNATRTRNHTRGSD